jgi:hypothetical protein
MESGQYGPSLVVREFSMGICSKEKQSLLAGSDPRGCPQGVAELRDMDEPAYRRARGQR